MCEFPGRLLQGPLCEWFELPDTDELQGVSMVFVLPVWELQGLAGMVFVLPGKILPVFVLHGTELQGIGIVFMLPGRELPGIGRVFVVPGEELHGTGELFVLQGRLLGWWIVENVKGIWKLTIGAIIEDVFCLTVDGNSGNNKLEINFNGNLNKLKESGDNLVDVRDEFVTKDGDFGTVDGDLVTENGGLVTEDGDFETEDGDFGTEYDDFGTEDFNFETEGGDFDAVDGTFGTENDGGSLTIKGDIGSGSGWGNGLNEIHRYFLGWVMVCITCK